MEKDRFIEGLLPTKAACSKVLATIAFPISQKFLQQIKRRSFPIWACTEQPWTGILKFLQLHSEGDKLICPNKNHKYKVLKKQKRIEGTSGQSSTVNKF